jgi:lipopolysaccharide export system permease protein
MGILTRHLSSRLCASTAILLVGFVSLVLTLDLMKNGEEVIARHGSGWSALALYVFLRLPEITSFVFLPAVLLGALLEVSRMVLSNEALAIGASGLPIWRILSAFFPAALALGALGLAVEAYMAPCASRSLARWDLARDPQIAITDSGEWVRDGASLVRIGRVSSDRHLLLDVSVFRLNDDGLLAEEIEAEAARFDRGQWTLLRVRSLDPTSGSDLTVGQMRWSTRLRPRYLASFGLPPRLMSFAPLAEHVVGHPPAADPAYLYTLELLRRIRVPLLVPLMILLAAPVLTELERFGGLVRALGLGAATGFGYFVIDGMALSLGVAGSLPAVVAAFVAPAIFAVLGVAVLLWQCF